MRTVTAKKPKPKGRVYSGEFMLRCDPELHRKLVHSARDEEEKTGERVSLNAFVNKLLVEALEARQ